MTFSDHVELVKLCVAYTLVGAFVFTVIITCLSLLGFVRFAVESQQKKLFGALIIELVVICLGSFSSILQLSAAEAGAAIQKPLTEKVQSLEEEVTSAKQNADEIGAKLNLAAMDGLRPEAVILANKLIESAKGHGITLRIVSGFRSLEQQQQLYAQGRTAPGPLVTNAKVSVHNTGLAFDVVIFNDGSYVWSDDKQYSEIGKLGKELGLVWGGEWKLPDVPHFETANARDQLAQMMKSA